MLANPLSVQPRSARCGIPWPMGCFERAELLSKLQQEAEGRSEISRLRLIFPPPKR